MYKLRTTEIQKLFRSSDVVLLTETYTDQLSAISFDNFRSYVLRRQERNVVARETIY